MHYMLPLIEGLVSIEASASIAAQPLFFQVQQQDPSLNGSNSEPGGWGPAVPTQIGSRQLRSSCAHCAQNLAVEVQPCPLRSEAGSWGPAVPTARGSWRRDWRRVGKAEVDVEVDADMVEEKLEEEEEEEAEEEAEKEEDEENSSDKI